VAGEFYGNERMLKVLSGDLQSPYDVLQSIKADVAEFAEGAEQSDDLTMLEMVYNEMPKNTLTVKAEVKYIDQVLDYVEQDIIKRKLPQSAQTKIMVATEEIFSNIAQYAYRTHGLVRILTYVEGDTYRICFVDNGVSYNPQDRKTPDLSLSAADRDIGGLGIFLVKELTDDVKYRREKSRNILDIGVKI
jgi:sigma-B regulation protein RsbU (phosphoserine phosphatase)